jgi:hypothetical protein
MPETDPYRDSAFFARPEHEGRGIPAFRAFLSARAVLRTAKKPTVRRGDKLSQGCVIRE